MGLCPFIRPSVRTGVPSIYLREGWAGGPVCRPYGMAYRARPEGRFLHGMETCPLIRLAFGHFLLTGGIGLLLGEGLRAATWGRPYGQVGTLRGGRVGTPSPTA